MKYTNVSDVVEIAKQVRETLKQLFPQTKFSVRCHRDVYADDINVRWQGDLPYHEVFQALEHFQWIRFNESNGQPFRFLYVKCHPIQESK